MVESWRGLSLAYRSHVMTLLRELHLLNNPPTEALGPSDLLSP